MESILNNVSTKTEIPVTKVNAAKKDSQERTKYNITRTPTIILIDDEGNEHTRWAGINREDIIIKTINEYK